MENKNSNKQVKNLTRNKKIIADIFNKSKVNILLLELGCLFLIISFFHFLSELAVFLLQTAAFILAAGKVFVRTSVDLRDRKLLTENTTVCITLLIAMVIGSTPEAVVTSVVFEVSKLVREYFERVARFTVSDLVDFGSKPITKIIDDELVSFSADKIRVGDIISVAPGEVIFADGIVVRGKSKVDLSEIIGKSEPVSCREGDRVFSGSINLDDTIVIESTADFSETLLTKITDTVKTAENKKSFRERSIVSFSKIFPSAIFAAAVFFGLIIPLLGSHEYTKWIYRALTCLVIGYPYALIVSIPLAYSTGISTGSKNGILFKSGEAMDICADLTSIVFDKTGTISTGEFAVVDIEPAEGLDAEDLLKLAACVESGANHPIARAICSYAEADYNESIVADRIDSAGKGCAVVLKNGITMCAGNAEMMEELGVAYVPASSSVTSVFISGGGKYMGRIDLVDAPKGDAAFAVESLRRMGVVNIALITGDNALAATRTGKEIGITEIYADCTAEDKVERINYLTKLQSDSERLAYVCGDSSNSDALASADIGIVINSLYDINTSDSSDIIVMKDGLSDVAELVGFAKRISRVISENILIYAGIKALLLILGLSGAMTIWAALLIDCAATQFTLLNSAKPLKKSDKTKTADS